MCIKNIGRNVTFNMHKLGHVPSKCQMSNVKFRAYCEHLSSRILYLTFETQMESISATYSQRVSAQIPVFQMSNGGYLR